MSTPEAKVLAEVKSTLASLDTQATIAAASVVDEAVSIWVRYDVWGAIIGTAIVCLIVGYHLHK